MEHGLVAGRRGIIRHDLTGFALGDNDGGVEVQRGRSPGLHARKHHE